MKSDDAKGAPSPVPLIPLIPAPSEKSADDAPAWLSPQERMAWADGYNACRGWWLHCQVEALTTTQV